MNKKDRKNSGRKENKIYHPETFPHEKTYWDDWIDYRDGFRNPKDNTKIRLFEFYGANTKKYNKKIKMLLIRQKLMKKSKFW